MHRYKPDMMTVLIILVAIGVITTTSIQAQEIRNNQPLYVTKMSVSCIDMSAGSVPCMSSRNDMMLGITDGSTVVADKLWQPHHLGQDDAQFAGPFFALKDHSCKKPHKSNKSSIYDEFSELKIGLSKYLTIDFEMDDISRLEISSIYLGFKDCW